MNAYRAVRRSLSLLSRRDRRLLGGAVVAQALLALLDLVAITLIGVVALLMTGSANLGSGAFSRAVESVGLENPIDSTVLVLIAVVAGLLMVVKSVVNFLASRRIFAFLASRQARLSAQMSDRLLEQTLLFVHRETSQNAAYALTVGVNALILGVLGQASVAVVELSLLVILGVGLSIINPEVTVFTISFFAIVAFLLQRVLGVWASRTGAQASMLQIKSYESAQESIRAYREITVLDRKDPYVRNFFDLRRRYAQTQADIQLMGLVSKYVFEVALIVGAGLLAGSQILTKPLGPALASIAIFLAAASRVTPSMLRLQSAATAVRTNAGVAAPAVELAVALGVSGNSPGWSYPGAPKGRALAVGTPKGAGLHEGFVPEIVASGLTLTFPDAIRPVLNNIHLHVPAFSSLAVVGPTGAGKTTLVDVLLGVIEPTSGFSTISGQSPLTAIQEWPGAIAYVPQDSYLCTGTVKSNIALGLPDEVIDDDRVWDALERAHLADFVSKERSGLETLVGEQGVRLSGGQRQRLGLARALYTSPKLLILDEATSALDAETEEAISASLRELHGRLSLVVIAHRLATVREMDAVAYLNDGEIQGWGSFDEVRAAVPAFQRQAGLLGIPETMTGHAP